MPSFKPKSVKKIHVHKKNAITLDGKHREYINDFSKDEMDKIPKLKVERLSLRQKIEEHYSCQNEEKVLSIEQILDLQDRIQEINSEIKSLKNRKLEYFLDNSKYIFDYFENKKNISEKIDNTNNVSKNNLYRVIYVVEIFDNFCFCRFNTGNILWQVPVNPFNCIKIFFTVTTNN